MAVREAELRIKPTMSDRGRKGLRKLRDEGRKAGREIERGFKGAVREGRVLERTYDSIGRAASGASHTAGQLVGHAMSLKGLAVGLAAGGAGKTIFDAMIGSNATLESQRITFNTMMGDVEKASSLMNQLRAYAASTPFAQGDLIDGSKRLLRLTGENVDQNVKLVKLASQMAAINPDKTISDAAEAILDAEGGEFERLKEFGLKLKKEDLKKMKKRGETLGQTALRGVEEGLKKQTGGRNVVEALSQSFNGKVSTLKDNIIETFRVAGEPAFEVLKEGLDDVGKDFAKLQADPEFKRDLKDLAELTADMARGSVKIARALPGAIKDAKELYKDAVSFVQENKTLLMIGGGAIGAHKLTGGATTRGAMALGSRALFGKKGGAAGAIAGMAGGAQPVFVVNMPSGGLPGGGSFLGRNAGKAGSVASAGGGSLLRSLAVKGVVGTFGAAGTAAGGVILGTTIGAVATLGYVTEKTSSAMKGFEKRTEMATVAQKKLEQRREQQHIKDVARENKELFSVGAKREDLFGDLRQTAHFARRGNKQETARLRGLFSTLSQTSSPEELAGIEERANSEVLERLGLRVRLRSGVAPQFSGSGDAAQAALNLNRSGALVDDRQRALQFAAAGANVATGLSQFMGDINITVQGSATGEVANQIASSAADQVESKIRAFEKIYAVMAPGGG